jgi:hypothetical protein
MRSTVSERIRNKLKIETHLHYAALAVVLFDVVLFFGFIAAAISGDLEDDALIVSIFLLVFCTTCSGGLCVLINGKSTKAKTIGLKVIIFSAAVQQLMVLILSFVEWVDPDCETDVLAVCSSQKENFLAAVGVAFLIHFVFVMFWLKLFAYWDALRGLRPRMVSTANPSPENGDWPSDSATFFSGRPAFQTESDDDISSASSGSSLKDARGDLLKEI